MSTHVTTTLICDLPAKKEHEAARTVQFSLAGKDYEGDYCEKDRAKLAAAYAPFIAAARPVASDAPRRRARRTQASRKRGAAIRAFARFHGLPVGDRGRIPASVIAQYEASL